MLDPELLSLLVCPETRQDVALASEAEIAALNEAILAGKVLTVAGVKVTEPVEGALVRVDRAVAYPIREDIPVMLVPEGLAIGGLNLNQATGAHA
jgi:uncharacterized protein YbaR (Trm112 family)